MLLFASVFEPFLLQVDGGLVGAEFSDPVGEEALLGRGALQGVAREQLLDEAARLARDTRKVFFLELVIQRGNARKGVSLVLTLISPLINTIFQQMRL